METMGLEPTTSCLQSRRSAGLSYVPKFFQDPIRYLHDYIHRQSGFLVEAPSSRISEVTGNDIHLHGSRHPARGAP